MLEMGWMKKFPRCSFSVRRTTPKIEMRLFVIFQILIIFVAIIAMAVLAIFVHLIFNFRPIASAQMRRHRHRHRRR
ncbi:hypothetical protein T01_13213 [Trichinella spiralis]|uniref:Uncharacterized protein n=1 Tax=Trichinella spiralis TaxID=6334 RepID=A0A0V1B9F0_TRISP|nr:hypothetical protein T01_13213 [Trichinella spiralis]